MDLFGEFQYHFFAWPFDYMLYFEVSNGKKTVRPEFPGMRVINFNKTKVVPQMAPFFEYEPDTNWDYEKKYIMKILRNETIFLENPI